MSYDRPQYRSALDKISDPYGGKMSLLLTLLGLAAVIVGFFWLIGGSLLYGIILIVVGLVLLGARYGGSIL